jgi:tetratricopeptide (TPR) repeat protein
VAADGRGLAAEAPVPRQLPGAVPRFIGRSAELAQLTSLLDQAADGGSTVVISAIGGTAGVGKTALAVHWAHLVAGRFPDGQLYVNLRGFGPSAAPMAPAEAVRVFLEGLGVAVERIPLGLGARAGLYRSLLAGRRMLIVADNARDPELVRPLLPGTPGCLVLVTSRNQLTGLAAADGAHLLTLDTLSEAEARELLENRLGQQRVAAEPGSVTELTGLCSRLPLALSIAAARAAARPELPLATLAAELRGTDARLDALGSRDAVTDVRTVFSWSCRQLTEPAARVFRLLGVHPGPDITVPAAASLAGLPRGQAEAALAELAGAHLVTEHVPDRYALHDLLRAYAAEQARDIDDDATRHAALQRVLDHYLHTAATASSQLNPFGEPVALDVPQPGVRPEQPAGREQAAEWFHAEQQVLLGAIARAASDGFSTHAWQLPWATATFFSWHGYWHELAATQESGLAAARQLGDLAAQAEIHRYLGRARAQLGDYTEAIVQLTALMELGQQLGSTITQARAHIDLGRVYDLQGRDSDAAPHAEQALRLYHAAGHRPGAAVALNAVGWSLTRLGRYQEAVDYIAQALAIHCELGDQLGEANTLDTLGYAYHLLGKPAEAIDCYERTLDLYGETGDRRSQAMTLTHLGDAHHAVGDGDAARRAWHRALDILDDLQHPDAGQLRSRLGLRPDGRGTGPGGAAANGATSGSWSQQPGR